MAQANISVDEQDKNIKEQFNTFLQNRGELISVLKEIADELDEVHKNVKITKVVTGSTGIVGTILCVSGLVLAIPTAGLSMFLTLGGGALAAASGTAHLGSDIAQRIITKSRLEKLDKLCRADEASFSGCNAFLQQANKKLQNGIGKHTGQQITSSIAGEVTSVSNLTCSIVRISQAATLTVSTLKFIGTASAVLSAVTLPVQIIDLALNSHALSQNQASDTSIKLRELVESLNTQLGNIKKYMEEHNLLTETL